GAPHPRRCRYPVDFPIMAILALLAILAIREPITILILSWSCPIWMTFSRPNVTVLHGPRERPTSGSWRKRLAAIPRVDFARGLPPCRRLVRPLLPNSKKPLLRKE